MWRAFKTVYTDRVIGVITLAMLVLGFTYASTFPYLSIIFVKQLGQSEETYSILMIALSITGMFSGVVLGYLSDFTPDRRRMIVTTLGIGGVAALAFYAVPTAVSFVICTLLMRPMASNAYGLMFASIRAHTADMAPSESASINSAVRTIYALSWIAVPGLVGAFIAASGSASDSFAFASAAFFASALIFIVYGRASGTGQPAAKASLRDALRLVAAPSLLTRITAISLINSSHALIAALLPLYVVSLSGASTTDVGILAGLTAALEMPFMIGAGAMLKRFPLWKIIIGGGLVHVAYLAALWSITARWQLYGFAVLNAAGASVLLTLHLSYCQDLIKDRPGLATSLYGLVNVFSVGVSALVFAAGAQLVGYAATALLGAVAVLAGCLMLFALERRR